MSVRTEKLEAAKAYIAARGLVPLPFGRAAPPREQRSSLENPRYSLDDPAVLDALWFDAGTIPPVRPQRALQTSAVYACVRVLAETMAQLPIHLYRRSSDGPVRVDNLPLHDVLTVEPNSYQTPGTMVEQGQAQCDLWGNAYFEIQFDQLTGNVIGLYPLPAWEVQPELISDGTRVKKIYHAGGHTFEDWEILHIPALGWDGIKGVAPIALHRATLTMSLNAEEFGANFFKNGTRLSGVLEHPGKLGKDATDRLKNSWSDVYAGKANAGKVAVLEEGMKFNPLTMPLVDAQFLEQRKFQVNDIARIFGVPPHKIGDLSRSTNNNIEHQAIEFVQDTMMRRVTRWEQEMNRKLFTATQRRRYFVKFDVSALMRGDLKSRYAAYAVARQWGWMSADDVRVAENMPKLKEGGDVYLSPMNMVPTNELGEEPAEPGEPANEGAPDPGEGGDEPATKED